MLGANTTEAFTSSAYTTPRSPRLLLLAQRSHCEGKLRTASLPHFGRRVLVRRRCHQEVISKRMVHVLHSNPQQHRPPEAQSRQENTRCEPIGEAEPWRRKCTEGFLLSSLPSVPSTKRQCAKRTEDVLTEHQQGPRCAPPLLRWQIQLAKYGLHAVDGRTPLKNLRSASPTQLLR